MKAFFGIILIVFITFYIYQKRKEEKLRLKKSEEKKKILAKKRKEVDQFYTSFYDDIIQNISARYPYISFEFIDYDNYKNLYFDNLITDFSSSQKNIHRVIEPLISDCRANYLEHNKKFFIPKIQEDNSDFWINEKDNRITKNGRDPSDWKTRRKIIFKRDQEKCQRCGKKESITTCHIHHIIRRAYGGTHSLNNLATLCKSCHTLMGGHSKMQSFRDYYISKNRIIHTHKCHHSKSSKKKKSSYIMLRNKGFTGCKTCKPWEFHEKAKGEWKFELEFYIHKLVKQYRESISLEENNVQHGV